MSEREYLIDGRRAVIHSLWTAGYGVCDETKQWFLTQDGRWTDGSKAGEVFGEWPTRAAAEAFLEELLAKSNRAVEQVAVPVEPDVKFPVGTLVSKVGGDYRFDGWVVGVMRKRSGVIRYNVEDDRGVVHIYGERNLIERADADQCSAVGGNMEDALGCAACLPCRARQVGESAGHTRFRTRIKFRLARRWPRHRDHAASRRGG